MYRIGEVYGYDSTWFLTTLAKLILLKGRHLELIFWVEEQQRVISIKKKKTAKKFYKSLDQQLQKEGVIKKIPNGSGKPNFLRDEQKLWNKLNLLIPNNKKSYFKPTTGLVFNWRNIISIINDGTLNI